MQSLQGFTYTVCNNDFKKYLQSSDCTKLKLPQGMNNYMIMNLS